MFEIIVSSYGNQCKLLLLCRWSLPVTINFQLNHNKIHADPHALFRRCQAKIPIVFALLLLLLNCYSAAKLFCSTNTWFSVLTLFSGKQHRQPIDIVILAFHFNGFFFRFICCSSWPGNHYYNLGKQVLWLEKPTKIHFITIHSIIEAILSIGCKWICKLPDTMPFDDRPKKRRVEEKKTL